MQITEPQPDVYLSLSQVEDLLHTSSRPPSPGQTSDLSSPGSPSGSGTSLTALHPINCKRAIARETSPSNSSTASSSCSSGLQDVHAEWLGSSPETSLTTYLLSPSSSISEGTSSPPSGLLTLPDPVLTSIWQLLDSGSRASLYHSCKGMWTSAALNSCITWCVVHNSLWELLTWPQNAGLPKLLRLVKTANIVPYPSAAALPLDPDSPSSISSGSFNLFALNMPESSSSSGCVQFLDEARANPRAVRLLSALEHVVIQGRGQDSEQDSRLASLLGGLAGHSLQTLQFDWCCLSGTLFASMGCWLKQLTSLNLTSVNSQDVRGTWPSSILTWSDVALLTSLTRLEVIDSHLPFLELGVQDITPLTTLTSLATLHLVFNEHEHPWPGSKPCYLLMGLGEVSRACSQLTEVLLDGVQVAKVIDPEWPSLRSLCLGFISGWHPTLLTALQLHTAAPKLKHLSLGQAKCSSASPDAQLLFSTRLLQAAQSLAACPVPPLRLELLVTPFLSTRLPLAQFLSSLAPLRPTLVCLSLHVDAILPGDGQALAAALPTLKRLQLSLRKESCSGLSEVLECMPSLSLVQLYGSAGFEGEHLHDGNVLSLCYAAYSTPRTGCLTLDVRHCSDFAANCVRELESVKPTSGHFVRVVVKD